MRKPVGLRAYALATRATTPVLKLWLRHRARVGKEDAERLAERWGRASATRPAGRLLWLHGASVGESLALLPLAQRARETRPDVSILVTTGTRAAAAMMAQRLPMGALHQYAPLDAPAAVKAFVGHWRPGLGVFVESEIWPNLLLAAKSGGARLALLSARMSEDSARRWRRAPKSARAVFDAFDLILARDDHEARRLESLGAKVDGCCDMKFGAAALPRDQPAVAALEARWRDRPVILAASTHPGEDELLLTAFRHARETRPDAVLVIAPRHPQRGSAIEDMALQLAFSVARGSAGEEPGGAAVFVADTIGELGTWYAVADLSLVGGSWVDGVGGHNPLEPARLGCPIAAGPYTRGWPVYGELAAIDAALIVPPDGLAAAMALTWSDPGRLKRLAMAARAFVADRDGLGLAGLDRTLALLA